MSLIYQIKFLTHKVALWFSTILLQTQDRSNGSNQGGPTQRASAMAALTSAFRPSSGNRTTAPRPSGRGQGSSQRAAAVAALSSVLTAETKKRSPDASPSRSSRSPPPPESSPSGKGTINTPAYLFEMALSVQGNTIIFRETQLFSIIYHNLPVSPTPMILPSEFNMPWKLYDTNLIFFFSWVLVFVHWDLNYRMKIHILTHAAAIKSEMAVSETEDSQGVSDANENEGAAAVPESNGEDSAPKREEQQDDIGTEAGQSTFSYDQLKAKSENPVTGIDFKRREVGSTLNMTISF